MHDKLFIEGKLRASDATRSLFDATAKLARAEKKTPLLTLAVKGKPGLLLVMRPEDLPMIAAEYQAARDSEANTDADL